MGTAFEVSALVLLDALVTELMQSLNLREKDLKAYHDVLSSAI
jgi:D-arabinose 5-phosphate isomerase GutQ